MWLKIINDGLYEISIKIILAYKITRQQSDNSVKLWNLNKWTIIYVLRPQNWVKLLKYKVLQLETNEG